jgi:hypothetical protein
MIHILLFNFKKIVKYFYSFLPYKIIFSLKQQNVFLMSQIVQINEKLRYLDLKQDDTSLVQTKASFDYQ